MGERDRVTTRTKVNVKWAECSSSIQQESQSESVPQKKNDEMTELQPRKETALSTSRHHYSQCRGGGKKETDKKGMRTSPLRT